ncbi:MAG: NADH-quinone oxidoreductase subunit NuoF [Sandaracinus sp.]|nr:NADH-quinone oxidoreductase subunit NuoF [Myxococcales bacterium]MAT27868.1 NADH-quinone oxidoreductase subunit NuoF [Sandaracinus sp.]MBJ71747.1 NADH-quinone oxidoreductase subunit NuoF [Sandaracinus sp.]
MADFKPLLSSRYDLEDSHTLAVAEKAGAYKVARKALMTMKPEQIREEVKKASLRGRGGAGFPAGVKWGFLNPQAGEDVYLVINGDESEPGTFKDRTIMNGDPHRLIEGMIITCWAIGAHTAYIYVRGELSHSIAYLDQALEEARAKGYVGDRPFGKPFPIHIYTHSGAGAYICGEETALLNSLEGRRGEPRLKPPFPAIKGAFDQPTIVNNVETIASVPDIVEMGGEAWCNLSRLAPRDGGQRLYGISGHVKKPGVYEAPVGITMRELIYEYGGGMLHDDRPLKGVIPGGSSTPVLRPDLTIDAKDEEHPLHAWHGQSEIDVPMGVDTYRAMGTMLGTCCAIVMDSSVNMVEVARNLMRFYRHESCGQCTPCREGGAWLVDVLTEICAGRGKVEDVHRIVDISNNMMGNTICAFGEGTAMPMLGLVQKYREEFVEAAEKGVPLDVRHDASTLELVRPGGRAA